MCGLFWGAHKSLAPRARTLLGGLGQATLSFFAVATLLFVFFGECPKFCDLAKQRRKIVGGVSKVGKDDFSLYFCWRCVIFLVFYFSSAAIARRTLLNKDKSPQVVRSFTGFCNYYSGYVRMYAELSGPLHKMLQVGKFDGRKGSKKKLAWTPEAEDAFNCLKERLLGQLGLFLVDPDKGFVLRTDASDYAVGAVLEQVRDDGTHVPVAFRSRILAEGQRRTWTVREKETYAIICALRKWSGHIGLQPVVVCTDHQSLKSWHKEHVDTPSGPAARRARWHETFAKFDLSVVYVPGKDNTVADCLSRWAYPAGKAWMDISSHGDAEETEEAKRIIEMEKVMEQEGVKCFVVMANRTDLAKFRGARVQAIREETLEQWMVAPVELVRSLLTEDWSDDYAASEHWSKYWNAVSAPSDDEWPEGLTEDGDKLFLKDKLLVPENQVEELIDHWHNAQLMHPGRDKMQQDLEWRFKFPPGY